MCVAVPAMVKSIFKDSAEVESYGIVNKVDISLIPDVKVDDFVLIHAGFAIQIIDRKEAEITQGYFDEYFSKSD